MKLVLLGDSQLIAPDDPHTGVHERRKAFTSAHHSFAALMRRVADESPDMMFLAGDLIDYFSDASRDMALELLGLARCPWAMTPGNHDFTTVVADADGQCKFIGVHENHADYLPHWNEADVDLSDRSFEFGAHKIHLVDSSRSTVTDESIARLERETQSDHRHILLTHVPPKHPKIFAAIDERSPQRSHYYLQDDRLSLFEGPLQDRFEMVFTGHLHYALHVPLGDMDFRILPLSIETQYDWGPEHNVGRAEATVLHLNAAPRLEVISGI